MKILITGANGFVARSLVKGLANHSVTAVTRADLDLEDTKAVEAFFADRHYDTVIHTAVRGGSRLNPNEDSAVAYSNLLMYHNITRNEASFDRFISFGSGAELDPTTPYGLSKHFIRESMQLNPKCFNIRIFAVFGEDELDTRFIKSNIVRYLNKQPMEVHQDRVMDFYYIEDLVSMVRWVVESEQPHSQELECSYRRRVSLLQLANMINKLDSHKVEVNIHHTGQGSAYHGVRTPTLYPLVGLEQGIKNVYAYLKNKNK